MGSCLSGPATDSDSFLITDDDQRNQVLLRNEEEPIFHPSPGISRPVSQLTEEEQIRIAKRMGLIQQLPSFRFSDDAMLKASECVICMGDYVEGEEIRRLHCRHAYHRECIDDWLMRSFTCPTCLEPVDSEMPAVCDS